MVSGRSWASTTSPEASLMRRGCIVAICGRIGPAQGVEWEIHSSFRYWRNVSVRIGWEDWASLEG